MRHEPGDAAAQLPGPRRQLHNSPAPLTLMSAASLKAASMLPLPETLTVSCLAAKSASLALPDPEIETCQAVYAALSVHAAATADVEHQIGLTDVFQKHLARARQVDLAKDPAQRKVMSRVRDPAPRQFGA